MLESLLQWDESLLLYLNQLGNESWDPIMVWVSKINVWIPFYLLLIGALAWRYQVRSLAWALLAVSLNVVATDQGSVRLFKNQFERLRPCHQEQLDGELRLPKGSCGGKYGFISSHASNTFGVAMLVGLMLRGLWPWALPLLLSWAAFISYSRVYLGVHFPGDILAGALWGVLCATIIYRLFRKYAKPSLR